MARILLAEDYDDLREMIGELLRQNGHVVDAFDNGQDAFDTLVQHNFDLLILDWDLPKMLGIDVCKNYRANSGLAPVLLLTGKKAITDKEEGFDAGADDYLTKPFHPKELISRIKALLRRVELHTTDYLAHAGELAAGTNFGERYKIIETLGRGSTGIIYKALHLFLNRVVALKVLHPQLISEPESLARFKREAQAVSCLSHPNIIRIHDFGITAQGLPFLVMDYSLGQTLMDRISAKRCLSPAEALPIFIQACDALAHAHERGVIHRDVKPTNMLLIQTEAGGEKLQIVDFGIAKVMQGEQSSQITQNGDVLGSPLYMSPEQCMGQNLDHRTDIFSLGCVMYMALVGREPFVGDNVLDTMYRRTVDTPCRFFIVDPNNTVPANLEAIVFKALERQPLNRYQSMTALKSDLERVLCAQHPVV